MRFSGKRLARKRGKETAAQFEGIEVLAVPRLVLEFQ
jgi:hypothetical protein